MESFAEIRQTMFPTRANRAEPLLVSKPVILVIDDNVDIMESLTNVLESSYQLIACSNYEEAKRFLLPEIKVVLLDIKMAEKDGIEVYKLLKEDREDLRIIFHSAYPGDSEKALEIEHLGHNGYLIKGEYQRPELFATIERALNQEGAGTTTRRSKSKKRNS